MINLDKIRKNKPINELLEFSILNIDKPAGPTSFGVDTIIKKELNLKKTSHFGTLDPMVTGILPVSLNRACKLMGYFIGKNKTYVGVMRLHQEISQEKLEEEIQNFIGTIIQLPPIKSRVKRQERERTIYTFKILEIKNKNILFESEVQAGTYIRKLIHDLGEKIGGAHMAELRRTQASIFKEPSIRIPEFLEIVKKYKEGNEEPLRNILIPGEIISQVLKEVQVKKECVKDLHHGKQLIKEFLKNKEKFDKFEKISVFQEENFIGIYEIINNEKLIGKALYVLQPIKQ